MGLVNNTIALVPEANTPCVSKYLRFNDDDTVKCFVPLTVEEKSWQKSTGGRVTLWGFGGAVELENGTFFGVIPIFCQNYGTDPLLFCQERGASGSKRVLSRRTETTNSAALVWLRSTTTTHASG